MFQMRGKIGLFCNVFRKEHGRQFGATIQRAKNMQYRRKKQSHWIWSMQKTVTKRTSHSKNVKCLKSVSVALFTNVTLAFCFLLCCFVFFFASRKLFTNFYKLSIFSTFKNDLVSRILAVFSIFFFFAWSKPKIVLSSLKKLLRPLSNL